MNTKQLSSSRTDTSFAKKREIRVANTFALIIGSFIISWTPLTVNFLVVAVTRNRQFFQDNGPLRIFHIFSICAAHFNSAIDPIIYAYRIKDIRETLKKFLGCNREIEATSRTSQTGNV